MSERQFFEYEALEDALVASQERLNFEFDTDFFLEKLGEENVNLLNEAILDILKEKEFESYVNTIQTIPPPNLKQGFDLKLKSSKKDGVTEKVTFFRVKKSVEDSALSLTSLVFAIKLLNPLGVIPAVGVIKTAFKNIITLKRTKHKNAILVIEAIPQVIMKNSVSSNHFPSTSEIYNEIGTLDMREIINGITLLFNEKLIRIKKWGEIENDYSHPQNTWDTTF